MPVSFTFPCSNRSPTPEATLRAAFADIVDYAGLFPPSECTLAEAVANFAGYRASDDRWMLGRFVVRATQLEELEAAVRSAAPPRADLPWPLTVVLGADPLSEIATLGDPTRRGADDVVRVEAVEARVASPANILDLARHIPPGVDAFLEFPAREPFDELCAALRQVALHAKFRTGGITPEAFPSARTLAAFIVAVTSCGIRFKATAGLHHPRRGRYPLTYQPGAPRHEMYGFVNVLIATAVALETGDASAVEAVLAESEPEAIVVGASGIRWRGREFPEPVLVHARQRAFLGFGSCSFREPVDELALGVAA